MDEMMRGILEAAIQAPSGENAQPWRFRIQGDTILQFHDPGSDESLYNYNGYGTLVAHGAGLENMALAAVAKGYTANIRIFPDQSNKNLIAELKIAAGTSDAPSSSLADFIGKRATNRKPYEVKPLTEEAGSALEKAAAPFASQGISYSRITDRKKMGVLAEVASTNERIMLGNKELHRFFFSHLTWTPEEDARVKRGFYIKTLELPPPVQGLFNLFKLWPVMKVLRTASFPTLVGKGNAKTYATSAEIGVIRVPHLSKEMCLAAGRLFERLWLTTASLGLQFQPLTGTIFMQIFAEHVPQGHFSSAERALLKKMMKQLNETTEGKGGSVLLMFRVGYGNPPSARALRFSLQELLV